VKETQLLGHTPFPSIHCFIFFLLMDITLLHNLFPTACYTACFVQPVSYSLFRTACFVQPVSYCLITQPVSYSLLHSLFRTAYYTACFVQPVTQPVLYCLSPVSSHTALSNQYIVCKGFVQIPKLCVNEVHSISILVFTGSAPCSTAQRIGRM
jgi:hypothetical protein